jgi:hypothetical protein
MIEFQTQCFDIHYHEFEKIIQDGIDNGEIIQHSIKLAKGLFVTAEGMFIASSSTNAIDSVQEELDKYIDALFELIELKS